MGLARSRSGSLGRLGLLAAMLALCAGLAPARATRHVDLYTVSVPAGTPLAEAETGMQAVLVRATGRLDAASDPALAPLVADAQQYVASETAAAGGAVVVAFDGARVAQAIVAAHRTVWDASRPFTIVVLSPPPTGAADNAARQSLEQLADARGLPIAVVPLPVTDASGQPLSDGALLDAAERLGGDAVLVGLEDSTGPSDAWHWTLVTGIASERWDGSFADAINRATDALAEARGTSIPHAVEEADVAVTGVETLGDYAALERMLADLPGVESSGLVEADGTAATFRVLIRGGAQAVASALARSPRLERIGAGDAPLAYRLQP